MKQYKLTPKSNQHPTSTPPSTTRQEIDEVAKHIARHIEQNPAKAAKVFEHWLNGKSKTTAKKKAA